MLKQWQQHILKTSRKNIFKRNSGSFTKYKNIPTYDDEDTTLALTLLNAVFQNFNTMENGQIHNF
jgi:hypothetical protein